MELVYNKDFQLAVLLIIAIVIGKLITMIVDFGFKKAVSNDYITKADCASCRQNNIERRSELSLQIRFIKGLLLVVAIKVGVAEDQLKELIEK